MVSWDKRGTIFSVQTWVFLKIIESGPSRVWTNKISNLVYGPLGYSLSYLFYFLFIFGNFRFYI